MKIKVGSLFDGIGGAPLSAVLSGAEPVWASEIEKVPTSITKRHFPNMKHYGDITQINGAEIEPVDIIVGGSPCQDLSVAGKRAGLEGARSGLFMDQVRIVKEMRNATRRETSDRSTELPRPRYMVWENVPGAFSSNEGEDFRAVLEETARVADPTISIPRSVNGWANSGSILADRFSISWRTFDAQYWGVPQRRRRIYLVADFGGQSAPEILFESESVPGDITEGGETGQRVAGDAERSSGAAGESCVKSAGFIGTNGVKAHGIGYEEEKSPTLVAGRSNDVVIESYGFEPGIAKREGNPNRFTENLCPTLRAKMGDNQAAVAYSLQGNMIGRADHNGPQGSGVNEDVSFTLNTVDRHAVCYGFSYKASSHAGTIGIEQEKAPTLLGARHDAAICYGISSYASNSMKSSNPHSGVYVADTSKTIDQNGGNPACNQGGIAVVQPICFEPRSQDGVHRIHGDISPTLNTAQGGQRQPCVMSVDCRNLRETAVHGTLQAKENGGQSLNYSGAIRTDYNVRRLTPLECERLQGYPDGWTALDHEGKPVSDSQRYKALGNSFAIPNVLFVISRCVKQLQKEEVNERD